MSKFKVGDRVRVLPRNKCCAEPGEATVVGWDGSDDSHALRYDIDDGSDDRLVQYLWSDESATLIGRDGFKVGDRVYYEDKHDGRNGYANVTGFDCDGWLELDCEYSDDTRRVLNPGKDVIIHQPATVPRAASEPAPGIVDGLDDYFAKKHDAGKPDFSLLPADVIALVCEIAAEARRCDIEGDGTYEVIAALSRGVAERSQYDLARAVVTLGNACCGGLPALLRGIVSVLEFGAKKYSRDSWQTVPDAERRYYSAAMRHALADDHADPESGLDHAFHLGCNLVFLCHLVGKSQAVAA